MMAGRIKWAALGVAGAAWLAVAGPMHGAHAAQDAEPAAASAPAAQEPTAEPAPEQGAEQAQRSAQEPTEDMPTTPTPEEAQAEQGTDQGADQGEAPANPDADATAEGTAPEATAPGATDADPATDPALDATDDALSASPFAACDALEGEAQTACIDTVIAEACASLEGDTAAVCADELRAADAAARLAEAEAEAEAGPEPGVRWAAAADVITRGGPIMMLLLVLSIISLAVAAVKIAQFTILGVGQHRYAAEIIAMARRGERDAALSILAKKRGPIARVLEAGVRGRALGSAREEIVREEVQRIAQSKLDGLERGLPLLSLIATVSPLLGLLGTVLGMIEAFQQLEGASDRVDPAILSGGIWEALLTTAGGLAVAIPAAALYTWLQRTVDVAGERMEDAAARIFTVDLYDEADTQAAA